MKKYGVAQQGFTLVELLVSMSVMIILLAALFSLLSNSLLAYQINSHRSEVQQTARIATDMVAREFKLANSITSVNDTSVTFTVPGASGDDIITIFLGNSDGILYIRRNSAGGQPITGANNVIITQNKPVFTVTGNNHILQINITAQYVGDNTATATITTSVTGMNIPKT